jgi:hypothetical protein
MRTIKHTIILRPDLCGIAVYREASVVVSRTTIQRAGGIGVINSGKDLRIRKTTIRNRTEGLVSVFDYASFAIDGCTLAGPAETPVQCFTAGFVEIKGSRLSGVAASPFWMHRGGSIACERVIITAPITADKLIKVESRPPIRFHCCELDGVGPIDIAINGNANEAQMGEGAVGPSCRQCGMAADYVFSDCGHAICCMACWSAMESKLTECPLCTFIIYKVVRAATSGHDEDPNLCPICSERRLDGRLWGCGPSLCSVCAEGWFRDHEDCPFCRENGKDYHLFVSYA